MRDGAHAEVMEIALLIFILLICPLSLLVGVDSRLDEKRWGDPRRL
jgi:hypothetical protein